jgi:muramoyltetrapeptide carboxypeptidase
VAAADRDGILVLEDINEHPFRVERMLLQLLTAVFSRQPRLSSAALPARANDYDAGYDLPQVFDYLRQQLPSGDQRTGFGHEQRTVTLPLGATRAGESGATTTLTISGHPVLTE